WNQSSPIQPSTMGLIGAATFNAGCGLTSAMTTVNPSYELASMPILPLDSGTFFTSHSIVSYASVEWSTMVALSGHLNGRAITYSSSDPYLPRTSGNTRI